MSNHITSQTSTAVGTSNSVGRYRVYPTAEMLRQFEMCGNACYFYAVSIGCLAVYALFTGSDRGLELRDTITFMVYATVCYQLSKRRFTWCVVALIFDVIDQSLFWPDRGLVDYDWMQLIFITAFVLGSVSVVRYHFYQKQHTQQLLHDLHPPH